MDKRKSNMQSISEVLEEILKNQKLNKGLFEHRIKGLWSQVLGPSVARVTRQIYVDNGVLYVYLNSSVIRGELLMLKDKIIKRLNDAVGEEVLRDVVFR